MEIVKKREEPDSHTKIDQDVAHMTQTCILQ